MSALLNNKLLYIIHTQQAELGSNRQCNKYLEYNNSQHKISSIFYKNIKYCSFESMFGLNQYNSIIYTIYD